MRFVVLTAVLDRVVDKVMTSCSTMLLLRRLATRVWRRRPGRRSYYISRGIYIGQWKRDRFLFE